MSKRPTVDQHLAEAINAMHGLLEEEAEGIAAEKRRAVLALLEMLAEDPVPVSIRLAAAIGRIDGILSAGYGYDYQYHITAGGGTIAAAHVPKAKDAPGNIIKPKSKRSH